MLSKDDGIFIPTVASLELPGMDVSEKNRWVLNPVRIKHNDGVGSNTLKYVTFAPSPGRCVIILNVFLMFVATI